MTPPTPPSAALDPALADLHTRLGRLRLRWRAYAGLAGAVRFFLIVILSCLVQLLLDVWFQLTLDQRAALNGLLTLVWAAAAYRFLLRALLAPLSDHALASVIDRAQPDAADRLAAVVQFAQGPPLDPRANSPQLIRAAVQQICASLQNLPFEFVLNHRRARRRAAELAALALIVAAAFALRPDLIGTWFNRNWLLADVPWPRMTRILPDGFDAAARRRVPRGDDLEIVARVLGAVPNSAELAWRTASGRRGRESMTLIGGERFEVSLGPLSEDLFFRITGGDERTREFHVVPVDRPRVLRTAAVITPPAYTRLPPTTVDKQSVFELLAGAAIRIDAWVNKPLAAARLLLPEVRAGGEPDALDCRLLEPDHLSVELPAPTPGVYRIDLLDCDALRDRNPVRLTLRVVPDRPPSARLAMPGVGEFITPQAQPDFEAAFEDAIGLSRGEVLAQRADDPPATLQPPEPLGLASAATAPATLPAPREAVWRDRLDLPALGAAPGDRLRVWAQAADTDPNGPNTAVSPAIDLRVVSVEDFLTEMSRRELALRQEFERLILSQRVLNDTLDRAVAEIPPNSEPGYALPPRVVQRLSAAARQQELHARRALLVRDQFARILAEMWTSKVAGASVDRRIRGGIVTPLDELAHSRIVDAVAAINALRHSATSEQRQAVRSAQADLLRIMQSILANMLRWEGYQEAVAMLRELIGAQADVRAQTIQAMRSQLDEILGLGEQPADKPPPPNP